MLSISKSNKKVRTISMTNSLGERISELLTKYGLTQRELAEKVNVTEVSMSRYIRGDRMPRGPILANIATVLHIEPHKLLEFR